ncbi:MAG: efflux RND transporter permease subunit [Proteobacteria bacterium]|nr:efflux RND transporter permease subunit [Pseudomonadota bacterium]
MTSYSLKNKGVVYFFYFLIVLMGANTVRTIPKQEDPQFPAWNGVIITHFPGASPQNVEELVTETIELKMREIGDLDKISSTSKTGISYVFVNVDQSVYDTAPIFDKVREKLDDLQGKLPDGTSIPFFDSDFGKSKSIVIAITGDGFSNRELLEVADDVKRDLGTLEYVSKVDLWGEQDQQIFLEFSNSRITQLGMDVSMFRNILIQQNVLSPGGEIKVGPQSIRLEASGEFKSIDDIKKTVINLPGSNTQFLIEDLFDVKREYMDPPKKEMRFMAQDSIGVIIEMEDGGQILKLGESVKKFLADKISDQYIGIEFSILNYQPKWVEIKIKDFVGNLVQAVVIVGICMLLLLGWREGLIISLLIPFSFLIAIILMSFIDIPIHQISLASFIIALGMLVDNGVVMTENIGQYIRQGISKKDAAIRSGKELTIPLLTATGTTVSAFLPIATAKSAVGIFCEAIAWVVGFVLLSSFLVSLTLIPLLCEKMMVAKKKKKKNKMNQAVSDWYTRFLRRCLQYKYITMGTVIVIFVAVIQLMGQVGFVFFPSSDRAQFTIDFRMPEGTDYRETKKEAMKVEQYLLEEYKDQISTMAAYIGKGGPRFQMAVSGDQQSSNYAQFVVNNHVFSETKRMIKELPTYFEENFIDAQATVKLLDSGPPVGAPIKIQVFGKDLDKLYAYADEIEQQMADTEGTRNVQNDWGDLIPKISININQDQARRVGISTQDISRALSSGFSGGKSTDYREGDKSIPIIMRSIEAERTSLTTLQNMKLQTSQGAMVPLTQVASIRLNWEAGKILHLNRLRTITLEAYLSGNRTSSSILEELKTKITAIDFAPGYGVTYSGEADASKKANDSIAAQLPLAFSIMVILLVAQFANVRKMIIILGTIPLSFIGIILGLIAVGYPFGFIALLGVISLAGIVVNNAILLLEQIQIGLDEGEIPVEAIIKSGQRRAYPIILTTLTTITGLYPLAVSGLFWGPMAVTVMSGLFVSAGLTLVVIPVFYAILFRVKYTPATQ